MIYPIDKETCGSCPSCKLVTKDFSGRDICEEEQYYQCISMADNMCRPVAEEDK